MRTHRTVGTVLGALILASMTAVAVASPAQATVTDDCKTVTVDLPVRPDSGVKGNNWAVNDMSRSTKVCALSDPVEGAEPGTLWWYKATITDKGTFTTAAGDSPNGTATLAGGTEGNATGGFEATFTAPRAWGDYKPDALSGDTSTPLWVATAFPGATFNAGGPVANWSWTYTTSCESWTNAESGNTGDITEKVCPADPTPTPTAQPTSAPTTEPTAEPTTPAADPTTAAPGAGGGLPITGVSAPTLIGIGAGLLVLGAAGLLLMRRRRTTFQA